MKEITTREEVVELIAQQLGGPNYKPGATKILECLEEHDCYVVPGEPTLEMYEVMENKYPFCNEEYEKGYCLWVDLIEGSPYLEEEE